MFYYVIYSVLSKNGKQIRLEFPNNKQLLTCQKITNSPVAMLSFKLNKGVPQGSDASVSCTIPKCHF